MDDGQHGKGINPRGLEFMNHAQEWDGVERRKARPSRDSIIDLLNSFGTAYPEPEKDAADFRGMYFELLAKPWAQRGTGLPYKTVLKIGLLAAGFLFLAGSALIFSIFSMESSGAYGMDLIEFIALGLWGTVIVGALLYVLWRLSINIRTRTHSFRKYPLVRKAAIQLADISKGETIRDYLPVLNINGKPFFQIVYVKKGDASKAPLGILILDDQGRAILQYGILENIKLTASIGIICGHVLQQRADHLRRSMRNVLEKGIPDAVRTLKKQEQQFAKYGLTSRWTAVMEGVSNLPQALRESITILDGEEEFRKAKGYGFALEFHHEDAQKLRKLYLAYVKFLNAAYRRKIISLTTEAAMLIQIMESKTDWREKDAALAALSTLAVAGTSSFLARICQKEYEGVVNDRERRAYEEKTEQAKQSGWAVVTE